MSDTVTSHWPATWRIVAVGKRSRTSSSSRSKGVSGTCSAALALIVLRSEAGARHEGQPHRPLVFAQVDNVGVIEQPIGLFTMTIDRELVPGLRVRQPRLDFGGRHFRHVALIF